jgi:parallel beta-helix repeat protein
VNVTVTDNEIGDVRGDETPGLFGVGVGVEANGTDYTVTNNEIDNVGYGIELKGAADKTTLTGNDFSETDFYLVDSTEKGIDLQQLFGREHARRRDTPRGGQPARRTGS